MNIWIITTGSSDVQLVTETSWNPLHSKVRNQLETQKQFCSSKSPDGKRYLYPARVMGKVYGTAIKNDLKYYEDLNFPLLNNFFWILNGKDGEADEIIIDRVIVLVTDQSKKFKSSEMNNPFSAFWQDTCTLEPILREYFKRRSIENPEFLILDPDPNKPSGLDNWNDVLERVQEKVKEKFSDFEPSEDLTVYVSHQAGTPAISSAVQFCSLAKFGDRVKFLVSNEQDLTLTDIVKSSAYLRGIEIQQAKKLLARHDYLGMKEVLKQQIKKANESKDQPKLEDEILKHIAYLLDIAIQWNFAKFEDFATDLIKYPDQNLVKSSQAHLKNIELAQAYLNNANLAEAYLQNPDQYWWWEAYEAAYLGVIRLKQGNTVEAMFHSFRAVEGLLKKWLATWFEVNEHSSKVERNLKNIKLPIKVRLSNEEDWDKFNTYGKGLYFALEALKGIDKDLDIDISIFGSFIFDRRNELFHQLGGLQDKDAVFAEWKAPNESNLDEKGWEDRVRNCLNFISDQQFTSIESTSLMSKVHQELKNTIEQL
ncbi:hypothetical protein [Alkalinema sp. FACHB-956]|uniref:hypothetical protein n=1 Tax=Alkalinema sp. FACHB-956 TaxID=2692768 RepID=UPI0016866219|nr:hypothetical protein [Alkalinema sp. FACHB-956]MBD2327965.1 hypothetical protein [Alkalinema sp. FACHB-956]